MTAESVAMHPIEWMKADQALDVHLGRMVRRASTLEYILEQVGKALSGSPYGALLISGQSVTTVIESCKALILAREDATEEWRDRFAGALVASKDAFNRRNQYVHGTVTWRAADGVPGTLRSRKLKPEATFVPLDLKDLSNLTDEFRRLTFEAGACLSAVLQGFPDHLVEDDSDD